MNWFYAKDNQQAGPVDDAELARLVQNGDVTDATLVWHGGLANWQPYGEARGAGGTAAAVATAPAAASVAPTGAVDLGKAVAAGGVTCVQCGQTFPADEVVRIGNANVCAGCKPVYVQRLREGAVADVRPYAGFGIRFGAALLDFVILIPLWVLYFGVVFIVLLPRLANSNDPDSGAAIGAQVLNVLMSLGLQLIVACYSAFCVSRFGGTPGKRICKLRVIRGEGGGAVSFWRALCRYLAKMFISRLIFFIGYLFIFFDEQKRALHDMICDTRVVYDNK